MAYQYLRNVPYFQSQSIHYYQSLNAILLLLLSVTMAYHSFLGIQVVIEDYVHAPGLKLAALLVSRFAHILLAVAAVFAILKIGLGA